MKLVILETSDAKLLKGIGIMVRGLGVEIIDTYPEIKAMKLRGKEQHLDQLMGIPGVTRVYIPDPLAEC